MSRRMKLSLVGGILVVLVGSIVALTAAKRNRRAVEVRLEQVGSRDLVATVTASGKIEPDKKVDVLSDIQGRITRIAVKEGDLVRKGDFLLQIDPVLYQAAVSRAQAQLSAATSDLVRAKANKDQAQRARERAQELQKSNSELISAEAVEQAVTAFDVAAANLESSQSQVEQAKAGLAEAEDNLRKTRLVAPLSGRVTRLAVEEGEVAVPGTFSRDVGLLMTIADMSTILAKVQVDETDVVRLAANDSVEVSIDAFPDTTFMGRVTKIANSAQLTATSTAGGSTDQAVDFDVEVTLSNPPADIRPDLSCTAKIVTDVRKGVLAVPIIALTVRENDPVPSESPPKTAVAAANPAAAAPKDSSGKPGKKKEAEGVFVVTDGVATFRAVKVGIAGEEYFEVVDGVKAGETIVAGSYQAIRDLKDGTKVKSAAADSAAKAKKS